MCLLCVCNGFAMMANYLLLQLHVLVSVYFYPLCDNAVYKLVTVAMMANWIL